MRPVPQAGVAGKPLMEKPVETAAPARRPWYRLHLSTWLILPLALAAAAFVVLPGEIGQYPQRLPFKSDYDGNPYTYGWHFQQALFWTPKIDYNAVVHGWPLPFLWRTPKGWTGDVANASRKLPWKLTDSVREFRLLPLAADLAIAAIGVALFAAIVEWRRRKRSRAFQFSLRELLIFTLLAAIALGWWNHWRLTDREVKTRLGGVAAESGVSFVPRLPLWLRTVVGDDALSRLGINGPTGTIVLLWDFAREKDIRYIIERFPRDTLLAIPRDTSGDEVRAIAAIDRLEQIEYTYPSPEKLSLLIAGLKNHPRLRSLTVALGAGSMDSALVAQIAALAHLESLAITGDTSRLAETELVELRNCKRLRELELPNVRLTQGALDCIGSLKHLRRLNLSGAQFIKANLAPISRLNDLEELSVESTNFDDDDAQQLRTLPSLRFLDITGAAVTAAGVGQLLEPSESRAARSLEQISLDSGVIDDKLIAALKQLPRLRRLSVNESFESMSWNGNGSGSGSSQLILKLRKALPNCEIILVPGVWAIT